MRLESVVGDAILRSPGAVVRSAWRRLHSTGSTMADSFDPYYTWLGIPPEEQPADHYRLLGIRRFEANEEVIINASDQRMAYIRTFQTGKRSKESQSLLNEISAAQVCLLNPEKKRAYDEVLRRACNLRRRFRRKDPSQPRPGRALRSRLYRSRSRRDHSLLRRPLRR